MAEHIGRCLDSWEVVHHIDGNNCNNSIDNLVLLPHQSMHQAYTFLQNRIRELEARITLLEADNAVLYAQLEPTGQGNPELSGDDNVS